MGPRYPPRPGVRMPQGMGNDFNGPPGQPLMPNNMDPTRQGEIKIKIINIVAYD